MQGRVLLEPEPERYSSFASGAVPAASHNRWRMILPFGPCSAMRQCSVVLVAWNALNAGYFVKKAVSGLIPMAQRAYDHNASCARCNCLCWHCDNQLRDQFTERLESMATDNRARWVLSVVRRDLGFDDSHAVTMPELCWWLVRNDLRMPYRKVQPVALRLPKPVCRLSPGK